MSNKTTRVAPEIIKIYQISANYPEWIPEWMIPDYLKEENIQNKINKKKN